MEDDHSGRRWLRAIPLPLMSSLLLIAAAWRISETGINDAFSSSLTSAAMILLGAWIREYDVAPKPRDPRDPLDPP